MKIIKAKTILFWACVSILIFGAGLLYWQVANNRHTARQPDDSGNAAEQLQKGEPDRKAETTETIASTLQSGIVVDREKADMPEAASAVAQRRAKAVDRINRQMEYRKRNLGKDYSELFARLSLSNENLNTLKELIVGLEFAAKNAWGDPRFASLEQPPPPEMVAPVAEEYKQLYNSDLKSLLGDEKFNEFSYYKETLPQRRACDVIAFRFAHEAEPLSQQAREQLIDVMYVSNRALMESGIPDLDNIARAKFFNDKTLEQAQSILTSEQMKSIENYYNGVIQSMEEKNKAIRDFSASKNN